jgi:hypothetical protein
LLAVQPPIRALFALRQTASHALTAHGPIAVALCGEGETDA